MAYVWKWPEEKIRIGVDFSDDLPEGGTITGGTATAEDWDGNDVSSTLLDGSPVVDEDGTALMIWIQGGSSQTHYKVWLTANVSDGGTLKRQFQVYVR
ncbi:hypothetical protein DRO49_03795 [Candidatus Bathyarchaeota archaeon]|nr:MAG: hypothetical protein DRO49_03795 [Candidatus Bathyarchaeota archaeon]